jgi:CotH protein
MKLYLSGIVFFLWATLGVSSQDLYDVSHIPEIRITLPMADWHHVLDSLKMSGRKDRVEATVTIDGQAFRQVGVRYKGNSSYKNPRSKGQRKLPFNLKADFVKKDQAFPGGFETIKLSNVFQDPSFLREILSYEIARKYMPASRCNFAKVFVNDEYLGFYNNTQAVDGVFLDKAFGASQNTFIKCDPEWEVIRQLDENNCPEGDKASLMYAGDDPDCYLGWYELESKKKKGWRELIDLTKLLNAHPENIEEAMNVDAVLWMHAFNNVLVNLDSYTGRLCHNYYLYRTPDSLFTPIVWDMNISFGGFRWDGEKAGELTNEEMQAYSMFAHYKNRDRKRPLLTNLLANPLYRKIYVGHCRTIVMENFANGEYLKTAKKIQDIIDENVENDPNKLYDYEGFRQNLVYTVSTGFSKAIGIVELMEKRTGYLMNHPLFNGKNPEVSDVVHERNGGGVQVTARVKDAENVFLAWRPNERSPFKRMEMAAGEDDLWSLQLDHAAPLQYYILAEGDRLAICSPERAAFEFYEVKAD